MILCAVCADKLRERRKVERLAPNSAKYICERCWKERFCRRYEVRRKNA